MNKKAVIEAVIASLVKAATSSDRASKEARQASIEAPSKMESRYDSTKSEQDWLAHGLAIMSAQHKVAIREIQAIDPTPRDHVQIGSLVTIEEDTGGMPETYILLPSGIGTTVEVDGKKVMVVTPESPMGKAVLGKDVEAWCEVVSPKGVRYIVITAVE